MIDRKVLPKRAMYPGENEPQYPQIYVSSDDLPETKDWQVGEKYCIQMEVVMTSKSDYKGRISSTFDVKKYCLADAEGDDLDEEEAAEGEPALRGGRKAR